MIWFVFEKNYDVKRYYCFPGTKFNLDKSLRRKETEMKSSERTRNINATANTGFCEVYIPYRKSVISTDVLTAQATPRKRYVCI